MEKINIKMKFKNKWVKKNIEILMIKMKILFKNKMKLHKIKIQMFKEETQLMEIFKNNQVKEIHYIKMKDMKIIKQKIKTIIYYKEIKMETIKSRIFQTDKVSLMMKFGKKDNKITLILQKVKIILLKKSLIMI